MIDRNAPCFFFGLNLDSTDIESDELASSWLHID
jgi:hypothetical protein